VEKSALENSSVSFRQSTFRVSFHRFMQKGPRNRLIPSKLSVANSFNNEGQLDRRFFKLWVSCGFFNKRDLFCLFCLFVCWNKTRKTKLRLLLGGKQTFWEWSHTGRGTNHVRTKDSGTNHVLVNENRCTFFFLFCFESTLLARQVQQKRVQMEVQ